MLVLVALLVVFRKLEWAVYIFGTSGHLLWLSALAPLELAAHKEHICVFLR